MDKLTSPDRFQPSWHRYTQAELLAISLLDVVILAKVQQIKNNSHQ
ncbi:MULTISPECIES: hypothetical protein [Aliivibrio]|nr:MULTISPECIES: hypothetical protein [Aliivibrio]MBB1312544.1 hypothetical protein [Aliivibrio sp. SR45-2]